MRYRDFAAFKAAHPDLAEVLETRSGENEFLASMREAAEKRKNFTPKMLNAIRKWVRAPVEEKLSSGERIRAKLSLTKVVVEIDRFDRVKRTFAFDRTAKGWRGKVEVAPGSRHRFEDLVEEQIGAELPTEVGTVPILLPLEVEVDAEVLWASPDGGFVILGDIDLVGPTAELEPTVAPGPAIPDIPVFRGFAPAAEEPGSSAPERPEEPAEEPRRGRRRRPSFDAWKTSLKL